MDDKEAIDYFLQELIENLRSEYNGDPDIQELEDSYVIGRLSDIAKQLAKSTNNATIQASPVINYKGLYKETND